MNAAENFYPRTDKIEPMCAEGKLHNPQLQNYLHLSVKKFARCRAYLVEGKSEARFAFRFARLASKLVRFGFDSLAEG